MHSCARYANTCSDTLKRAHTCTYTSRHAGACCIHTHTQHTLVSTGMVTLMHTHAQANTDQPPLDADGVREGDGVGPLWGSLLQRTALLPVGTVPRGVASAGSHGDSSSFAQCRALWARHGHGSPHPRHVAPAHSPHLQKQRSPAAQQGKAPMGQTGPSNPRAAQNYQAFCPISLPRALSHWSRQEVQASLRMWSVPKSALHLAQTKWGSACCWKTSAKGLGLWVAPCPASPTNS